MIANSWEFSKNRKRRGDEGDVVRGCFLKGTFLRGWWSDGRKRRRKETHLRGMNM
jgi:hypothetical protein